MVVLPAQSDPRDILSPRFCESVQSETRPTLSAYQYNIERFIDSAVVSTQSDPIATLSAYYLTRLNCIEHWIVLVSDDSVRISRLIWSL